MEIERFGRVRAVFFDLDDTLCGYWDAAKTGLRRTFEAMPLPGLGTEQALLEWAAAFREFCPTIKRSDWYALYLEKGRTTRAELMRRTLLRVGLDDPARAEELADRYGAERRAALALFPGTLDVLREVGARHPMGLITNGPADVQREEIRDLGLEPLFQWILIEGELGYGKPDPRVFRLAERLSGCAPEEILFVGNSYRHDVRPAQAAGWRTVWVRRPSDVPPSADPSAKPEGKPEGAPDADAEIGDLRELLTLLA
ncbi:MAG: HAD family hydrolase [Fimbriimonadales bacterium]|nr:HAD family hydrolase [Fimbriimonadales bacterium]